MNYYKKAKEIMDMDTTEFVGGASKVEIENAMKTLSVVFPGIRAVPSFLVLMRLAVSVV